ncbi:hypothetical protein DRQ09_06505 [candidate division KSB1 bacterium]|nr:MAG: hypothetical protein DRQ09_06505 [candidate division KSB1 bacterium]
MKKAFVTGGTGFIGGHLIESLLKKGYKVSCLVRKNSNKSMIENMNVEVIEGDLNEKELLKERLGEFEYVFHFAGLTKAKKKEEFFKVNLDGTKNLIESIIEKKISLKRFLYCSSMAAGGPSGEFKRKKEEDDSTPVSDYGISKLYTEEYLKKFYSYLPITIIRPPAVYGPRDKDFLLMFKLVKSGIKPILGTHKKYYNIVYIKDLVRGSILAAEDEGSVSEIYYIADPNIYTWQDFVNEVAGFFHIKTLEVKIPDSFLDAIAFFSENISRLNAKSSVISVQKVKELKQKYWLCDTTKAEKKLGFSPEYSLKDGIEETAQWYIDNGWL